MLGSIRKFSTSIYAKILLIIIIIPFVFWGMGSSITGGSKNIVVIIDKEKYSVQQLSNFINRTATEKVKADKIGHFLSTFIGEKLIEKEIKKFGIKFSDKSLSKLIRHQKNFQRDNKFSRTEYEKFLLKNNITAADFESMLSKNEKKTQFLDFISGGIYPPKFLVNISYDRINQRRKIQLINLNKVYKEKLNFSEKQINTYFNNNIDNYTEEYKIINLLELSPKKLVGEDEFTDLFFKKIDEIDDLIVSGEKFNQIINKFNLGNSSQYIVNASGLHLKNEKNITLPKNLIKKAFSLDETLTLSLIEDKNKFFILEFVKTEYIKKNIKNEFVKKDILTDLERITKRKLTAEIIGKINENNFSKRDFDNLSKDAQVVIQKINLENQNDIKILKKEILTEIYQYPEKKIIVINDLSFSENYLIYIDEIKNVNIDDNNEKYQEYLNLSKVKVVSDLYNTYDNYIKKRYKIDINYQALDVVKNYYN